MGLFRRIIQHPVRLTILCTIAILLVAIGFSHKLNPSRVPSVAAQDNIPSVSPLSPVSTEMNPYKKTAIQIKDMDFIRVGISDRGMTEQEYPLSRITATGGYYIIDSSTQNKVYTGKATEAVTFNVDSNGFYVIPDLLKSKLGPFQGPLKVYPEPAGSSYLQVLNISRAGKIPSYKGIFEITRGYSSKSKFSLVNILPLQDYLKAVVPNEMPYSFGYEAIKTQAVAARNYAIRPREKSFPQFDICDSQYCQVYFGVQTEHQLTNKAIEETFGLIALYEGDPILALYSSSHGGYAEAYQNSFSDPGSKMFPGTPIPYLRGGPDIPEAVKDFKDLSQEEAARAFWTRKDLPSYDTKTSLYRWEKSWTRPELEALLKTSLLKVSQDNSTKAFITPLYDPNQSFGTLQSVSVTRRGISGKAMEIVIKSDKGQWTVRKEFVIRKVLQHNGKMLPSANIILTPMEDPVKGGLYGIKAQGGGFGHGVGMSQYGASMMSGLKFSFDQILQHYYKGVAIGSIPLVVGNNKGGNTPIPEKTEFYTKEAKGYLRIQAAPSPTPILLKINDTNLQLTLNDDNAGIAPLGSYLKAGQHNTFTLYPDPQNPSRPIKAWIEIVPAQNAPWLKLLKG